MLATYDVRRSPTRAFVISFLLAASLVIGGAAGFALKGISQSVVLSPTAPVVASSLAGPMMTGHSAAQLTRIELNDQQSQAQSASLRTVGAGPQGKHANPRFSPR
jgi:zinc transporter ZupT